MKILEFVERKGGRATLSDIHRHLSGRVQANTFRTVIQTLVMVGRLVMEGERAVRIAGWERRNGTS